LLFTIIEEGPDRERTMISHRKEALRAQKRGKKSAFKTREKKGVRIDRFSGASRGEKRRPFTVEKEEEKSESARRKRASTTQRLEGEKKNGMSAA